jgi:hypothetical protein
MMARLALAAMILLALLIRMREIDEGIVRFHPTRHYRSAVIARACYYDHARGIPEKAQQVARANREMQQAGELPVMEALACGAYLAIGRENVMIPRIFAVMIWVLGAIPLFALASRLASAPAALIAVALYLFLPYGIVASRNFQPDQLMTVASVIAILALVRHHDRPTRLRFAAAAAAVGMAGLIKPMSVFLTIPVALAVAFRPKEDGHGKRSGVAVAFAGLLPPLIYYGYSAVAGSLVRDQMRMRFEPHLIATPFFYNGMAQMISRVETIPLFVLALVATCLARDRVARRVLAALFAGYLMFAVVFTYHMPTHDYYHLPYLAVTALGVGALLARLERWIPKPAVALLCAIIAVAGSIAAWPRLRLDDAANFARIYEEIGGLAEHDTKALFLDTEYGFALMYHGEISGDSWPNNDDLAAEAIDGRAAIDAEARFARDYEAWQPRFFIVTDLGSLASQPDLQALLDRRATPVRITERYRVYRFVPRPPRNDRSQNLH